MYSTPIVFVSHVSKAYWSYQANSGYSEELKRRAEERLAHIPGCPTLPRVDFQSMTTFFHLHLRLENNMNA